MQQLAEDVNDPVSQRAAFQFLGRCVLVWLEPASGSNGQANGQSQTLPGFERYVYERLIPSAFSVLASPQFNVKDGQMLVVSASLNGSPHCSHLSPPLRSFTRYATSCQLSLRPEAKSRSISSLKFSCPPRAGRQRLRRSSPRSSGSSTARLSKSTSRILFVLHVHNTICAFLR